MFFASLVFTQLPAVATRFGTGPLRVSSSSISFVSGGNARESDSAKLSR